MSQNFKVLFPQTRTRINGQSLVYLDGAATTLKPAVVIDAVTRYYSEQVANVHRGAHHLADAGTSLYEGARAQVAKFIGASSPDEVIFTRGTTEGINLVASSFAQSYLKPGDEILITELEHHSNIVPWQIAAQKTGAVLRVVPILDSGDLDLKAYSELLSSKTKIVSFLSASNALGVVNPVVEMIQMAKTVGAKTLVDAAQSMTTLPTDVRAWDCDFLVFSGHKVFGPTGIGVLYGKKDVLNAMPPYQSGGSMIDQVTFEATTYLPAPQRFEAGTPNIEGAIGLGVAVDFIERVGLKVIHANESHLVNKSIDRLSNVPGVRLIGSPAQRINVVSFLIEGVHYGDVGALLDQQGIAVRVGHHCCQPLMRRLGVAGTVRASFSLYNDESDVDRLVDGIKKVKEFF
jgi:cysteine desulfurase/selenocysteine lyase